MGDGKSANKSETLSRHDNFTHFYIVSEIFSMRLIFKHYIQSFRAFKNKLIRRLIHRSVMDIIMFDVRIFVHPERVKIAKTASMSNAFLNTNSGTITVGEYTFCGQNVSIITGTHDYALRGGERQNTIPQQGHNIVIGRGVWLASNVLILGPCTIGDNAVVAAGSVVINDVQANTLVAGVPARFVKSL